MSPEREPTSPACVSALVAHVLEVEVVVPDVLDDVLDVDTVAGSEAHGAAGSWASTTTVGPSTQDAARALGCGVSVGATEMLVEDGFVDGDLFAAVVNHAAYNGRRRELGNGSWGK
jgi:hypothetical protein